MTNDFDVINKFFAARTTDLPYQRFLLQDVGGLPKEQVDIIIQRLIDDPKGYYELMKNHEI